METAHVDYISGNLAGFLYLFLILW
jgi:hypothetical protein